MKRQLCVFHFKNVHFGNGTLESSAETFSASRLFSALFLEALKLGKQADFLKVAQSADFVLSDAFPMIDGVPFLPKPIGYPKFEKQNFTDLKKVRRTAKTSKKLAFIPFDEMTDYLKQTADLADLVKLQNSFFNLSYLTKKGQDPYQVGIVSFKQPLYCITSQNDLLNELLESLQYSGLGGKRTSGYGSFELRIKALPKELEEHLSDHNTNTLWMSLTTSLPQVDEMKKSLTDENYLLTREGGFAYSEQTGSPLRKQDMYKFKAGSTFTHRYSGQIFDIRPQDFPHPVWNFSKSLFYSLEV
ncbi:type III-A CRISPR-associated RAMP protein Csm4 [Lentilactobacillus parakefiri]|uniref:CRISPR system Cms protein Csm4 n=1 Tax=Lentilactobacillus parakefiri TaxID=152332 RepID=A0A269Y3L8_9LACO|nr:type III-A CRISPR-associated RAMP protein Csm4 [Lentilactobacillus parakefiri]PAK80125.1 type III-A CRISPR-associated RAMP protein Csm4 [Lentilactobacillus parakefiri]